VNLSLLVGRPSADPDFDLSGCPSLLDAASTLERLLRSEPRERALSIVLGLPVAEGVSIPLAFRSLMGAARIVGAQERDVAVWVDSAEMLDQFTRYLPPSMAPTLTLTEGRLQIEFRTGDIVAVEADAIVNPSNPGLKLGGGVSGAIRAAAHSGLQAHLDGKARLGPLPDGTVIQTDGFGLPKMRSIFHLVIAHGVPSVVTSAVRTILGECDRQGMVSIAFPAIGTGSVGLRLDDFTAAFRDGVIGYLAEHPAGSVERLVVVLWTRGEFDQVVARWPG
jgi:O-acetyl-ADP-ribose deacetylase (regulator of RNase III)